jgi:TatD DNase family protein
MLVDSHCHLNYAQLVGDLEGVVQRATDQGVEVMLTINTRLSEAKEHQAIADRYKQIYCTVGVHPHDAMDYINDSEDNLASVNSLMAHIRELAAHPKVVGIGETGLDYHYNKSPREAQMASFGAHIRVACELNLPLVIHTRNADSDTVACLKNEGQGKIRGVFHCFSGSADLCRQALELGFYISFSGILTFKNAEDLRSIAKDVPLDRILVETDSPYLAPVPHRGQSNEPAFTRYVAERLAELKGLTYKAVEEATTHNFFALFDKATRNI